MTRPDEFANRIEPTATWDDLVLPTHALEVLRTIPLHLRHRRQVYEAWGFGQKPHRDMGVNVLFAGESGTGKTLAANVLASDLQLDLHRIDLGRVVSKYIGETEKNLERIFDAAEGSSAILFFDEADALFGKRSEVKDSHDRYANVEVNYLLQSLDAWQGLCLFAVGAKSNLDEAFLRRLRFVVKFPLPDADARTAIWRRVFPPLTPTEHLDFAQLATLEVTGGSIHNIALTATFLAAENDSPVGMDHIQAAARMEYLRLEKPFSS